MENWAAAARSAEERLDWDEAISILSAFAECHSPDYVRHDAHLWHMHALAQAGRLADLADLARSDRHALRQLDRTLYAEAQYGELRRRAADGDRYASLLLARKPHEQRSGEVLDALEAALPEEKGGPARTGSA